MGRLLGFDLSGLERKAVEQHAMNLALEYYRERWNIVDDVHERESYDLRCRRSKLEHHVEVKGTTGSDTAILLSKNEVQHARDFYPNVSLFIVSEVRLEDDQTGPIATGGHIRIIDPWRIDTCRLIALTYQCSLPNDPPGEPGPSRVPAA
jgi:Protein NO VEIN, C-terminal